MIGVIRTFGLTLELKFEPEVRNSSRSRFTEFNAVLARKKKSKTFDFSFNFLK